MVCCERLWSQPSGHIVTKMTLKIETLQRQAVNFILEYLRCSADEIKAQRNCNIAARTAMPERDDELTLSRTGGQLQLQHNVPAILMCLPREVALRLILSQVSLVRALVEQQLFWT